MLVFNKIKIVLLTASIVDLCTYTNDASIRFASDVANHPELSVEVSLVSQQIFPANKSVLFKGFVFCCYPSNSGVARPGPTRACALPSTSQALPSPTQLESRDSTMNQTKVNKYIFTLLC